MIEQTGRDIVTRTLLLAWINSQRSDSLKPAARVWPRSTPTAVELRDCASAEPACTITP
jgi:hypothetical protein